jgi:TRAP-type C4-dicarboxylate transport system permease small subunit
MTVKDILIAILFLASTVLAIYGGWNYMKGRINQYEEIQKAEKLATQGYNAEEALQKIRRSKTNSLILFAAGTTGIFLIITNASRRPVRRSERNRLNNSSKQILKENQL